MFIKTFPVGAFQCNCTIIGDENTGEAIVADPGDEADKILSELKKKSFTVKYLLHTHAHLDHIGATKTMHEKTKAGIVLHKDDLFLYENIAMQGQLLGLSLPSEVSPVTHYLTQGDTVEWKGGRAEILHTPGHTPGSLCFLIPNAANGQDILFSGDTLFMSSIGRTDLWGGDYDQIISSIQTRLMTLDEKVQVVCGHGPMTTIGREKKINPFLQ